MQEIKIKTDGAFSEIFIDGKKIEGVRCYELTHGAGGVPILRIDLNALKLDVDGRILLYDKHSCQKMRIVWEEDVLPEGSTETFH